MSVQPPTEVKHKVVIIGSSSVGKTCIIMRFAKKTHNPNQEPTIGAAFVTKPVSTKQGTVILNVWDTAGQERYKSLVPKYFKGAMAYIVVFDVTDKESFYAAQDWLDVVRATGGPNAVVYFVGNKIDLTPTFDTNEAKTFAKEQGLTYMETSANTGENVDNLFEQIAENLPKTSPEVDNGIDLIKGNASSGSNCC